MRNTSMTDSMNNSYQPRAHSRKQLFYDLANSFSSKEDVTPTTKDLGTSRQPPRKPAVIRGSRADLLGYSEKSSLFSHSVASSSIEREIAGNGRRRREAEESFEYMMKKNEIYENPELVVFNNGKLLRESRLNSIQQAEIASTFIFNQIYNEKKKVRLGFRSSQKAGLLDSDNATKIQYAARNDADSDNEEEEPNIATLLTRSLRDKTSYDSKKKLAPPKPTLNDIIASVPGVANDDLTTELAKYEQELNAHHNGLGEDEDSYVDANQQTTKEKRAKFLNGFNTKRFYSASSYHQHHKTKPEQNNSSPARGYENNFIATRHAFQKKLQEKFSRSPDFVANLKPIEVEMFLKMDEEFEKELNHIQQKQGNDDEQISRLVLQAQSSGNEHQCSEIKLIVIDDLYHKVHSLDEDDWMYC